MDGTSKVFAEYVRWRWLSNADDRASKMKSDFGERSPRTYKQLFYECLETNPVGITRGLVELQDSSPARFDFFDEDAVGKWTDELLMGADGITECLVESDAPIADVLRVQTLIGNVRPINEIPHKRLLDRYEQSDAGRDSADAVFGLLTITFRQAEKIAGPEQRGVDDDELPISADDAFEWAQSWLDELDSLAADSDDDEIRLELANGLHNAAKPEGEAGPEYFEAMEARLNRLEELVLDNPDHKEIQEPVLTGYLMALTRYVEADAYSTVSEIVSTIDEMADTAGEFWLGERGSVLRDATVRIGLELLRADRLDLFEEFVGTFRSAVSEGRWESISMKLVLAANELLGEDDISLDTHQRVVDIIENPDKS